MSTAASEGGGSKRDNQGIVSKTGHANVDGVNLFYIRKGPEDANRTILCMCGALGTAQTDFGPQLEALSQKYTVISFDPRGYGSSRPPDRDFPKGFYRRDAEDAAGLMRVLGIDKYNVIGWSDGANSGVHLAAHHAQHVQRLVLVCGNAYITQHDIDGYEKTRDTANWSERMRASLTPVYGDKLQPMWDKFCDAMVSIFEDENGSICKEEAPKVKCKTLVVAGAKDPLVPLEHARYFEENLGGKTRVHVFPEGKHNPHLRFADEFNPLADAFFSEGDDE